MKKLFLLSFSMLFSFGLVSCNKEKNCACTNVQVATDATGEWEDLLDGYNQTSNYPQTIKSGECSDLNATSTSNMMGIQIKSTITCVEK